VGNDRRVDEILEDWLEREERGEGPSPEEVIRAHPSLSEELRARFAALHAVDEVLAGERTALPREVGGYRIVREVGRGGMGVVYQALDPAGGRPVALKVLYPGLADTPEVVRRLQRQSLISHRLQHPAIVCARGVDHAGGVWFYTMDFVQGRSLSLLVDALRGLRGRKPSDPSLDEWIRNRSARTAELFAPLADALQFVHERGVVHRDIKPSNLILGDDGVLKLTDLDLARITSGSGTITESGAVLGTPSYMSPEQAMGGRADARSDIYSLGATLYEWLTLSPPFTGQSFAELYEQILRKPPVPPRRHDESVPRALELVVLKAMEKQPARRYPSAAQFGEDLRRAAAGQRIAARPPSGVRRAILLARRHPKSSALLATLLLVLLMGGALAVSNAVARSRNLLQWVDEATWLLRQGDVGGARRAVTLILQADPRDSAGLALADKCRRAMEECGREADVLESAGTTAAVAAEAAQRRMGELESRVDRQRTAGLTRWVTTPQRGHYAAEERLLARDTAEAEARNIEMEALRRRVALLREGRVAAAKTVKEETLARLRAAWRIARTGGARERESVFRSAATRWGPGGELRWDDWTRGRLRIAAQPAGAEIFLFRWVSHEEIRPEDSPIPRLVPCPVSERGDLLPEPWAGGWRPGDPCLVVTSVAAGSLAERASVTPGDLILRVNGAACAPGLLVASLDPKGKAAEAGVEPLDRIEMNCGMAVESRFEWDFTPRPASPNDARPIIVRIGTRDLAIPRGEVPAEALGVTAGEASELIAGMAPGRGMSLLILHGAEPLQLEVPAGESSGLASEPAANALLLSPRHRMLGGATLTLEGGSYLVVARLPGFELQRFSILVPDEGEAEAALRLLPEGSTPPGFEYIPPGEFFVGGEEGGLPREQRRGGGFFLARHELRMREYFEFLSDPAVSARIRAELAEGRVILLPRIDQGPSPDHEACDTVVLADGTFALRRGSMEAALRGVSFDDLVEYLAWRNRRAESGKERWRYSLPTEEQWEQAARGADGRLYPWGNRFDFGLCVGMHWTEGLLHLWPGGSEPEDESPYGIRDMGGSQQEWVLSGSDVMPGSHVLRGGHFGGHEPRQYLGTFRETKPSGTFHMYHGVRLVARAAGTQDAR
jgi:serine/threonine protein kinase/formylglycine-generating enzyme required for sulfatase activity